MAKPDIPPEVRRFVLTSIPSVPHLEALMLMRATAPAPWSAQDLAQRLYVSPAVARALIADLNTCGMLRCDDLSSGCSFNTHSQALCGVVDALAQYYSSHLLDITHLIHSRLERKAQQFADAFKLRSSS